MKLWKYVITLWIAGVIGAGAVLPLPAVSLNKTSLHFLLKGTPVGYTLGVVTLAGTSLALYKLFENNISDGMPFLVRVKK